MRGAVVKVETNDVYVSLGTAHGLTATSRLRFKRPVQLKHPISKAVIDDWIPIGVANVTQVGSTLSRAVVGALAGELRVGDIAEALGPEPVAAAASAAADPPAVSEPQGPPVDPASLEVTNLFAAQSGQPLAARIAAWEGYLSSHPDAPWTAQLLEETELLREVADQVRSQAPSAAAPSARVRHQARTHASAGRDLPLVFVLDEPDQIASAHLYYRSRGARTFHDELLARDHRRYLRGQLPAAVMVAPGVEYFVEVSSPQGRSSSAVGSAQEPVELTIETRPLLAQLRAVPGRSTARFYLEALDFATFDGRDGDHTDDLFTANVDFVYRLAGAVQSFGVGYGVLRGRGGYADRTWSSTEPVPHAGFNYGYADVEYQLAERLSLGARLIAGVGRRGFGLGAEGRLRIGDREATNLEVIGRTLEEVGVLSEVRFGVSPVAKLLLGISVGVTNQPNDGDLGAKLGTDLQWAGFANLAFIIRGSWQGRTVDHGGVGGGAGVGLSW